MLFSEKYQQLVVETPGPFSSFATSLTDLLAKGYIKYYKGWKFTSSYFKTHFVLIKQIAYKVIRNFSKPFKFITPAVYTFPFYQAD